MLGWEFPPFVSGGLGVHCYELTKEFVKRGVEIDFYMPRRKNEELDPELPGINIIQVDSSILNPYTHVKEELKETYGWSFFQAVQKYNNTCGKAVEKFGKEEEYDLVHSHDWLTTQTAAYAKKILKIPYVFTIHSTEYDRSPSNQWRDVLALERLGLRNADRVITVSNRMRGQLLKMGAPREKIRVIYNGVDFEKFDKKKFEKRKKKTVLFLGRLTEQKGVVQFIHAAKMVLEKEKDARFVIVGQGPMLPHLIKLTLDLGIADRVSFTGYIPEEQQRKAYALSDVFVMPSVSEPFGIVALESIASGTPCIVSKTSGVSEVLKNCLKVDFWDVDDMAMKIIALFRYSVLAETLSKRGMVEVERFNWGITAEQTLDVYNELL